MTRVVHVVVAGEIGGAERMLVDLASRPPLSGAEHTIALMTPSAKLRDLFRDARLDVRDRGAVRENPAAFLWRSLGPSDVAWLAGVMRDAGARVAHLHTFGSQVIGTRAALRAGARVLRTEHSTRVYVDPSCWPFSRWSLRRADAVVAISRHIRDVALSRAPEIAPRLRVVPNGVDLARFSPRPFGAKGARCRFVAVGRLEPRKGFDVLLEAIAQTPDVELDLVGDGDARARLETLALRLGLGDRARLHGYVADPRELVASCDAAVCSSREEGLGIGLLEAMALGRAVVSVPVGGVPEFVEHGVTGFLAKDGSASALAAALREAARDRDALRSYGERARARVRDAFSIERMCEGYARAYADVTGS